MKVFKSYVKNKDSPERCIAKNYTVEESIKFFVGNVGSMKYIGSMPNTNEAWDDEEGEVSHYGKALYIVTSIQLENTSLSQAHRWALHNTYEF